MGFFSKIVIGLASVAVSGCAEVGGQIVEAKDIQFLKVEEIPGAKPPKLRLSGLVFKSAMSVQDITAKEEGKRLMVLVRIALARPGTSGSFNYELVVPDGVDEVVFGNERTVVWKRGQGQK